MSFPRWEHYPMGLLRLSTFQMGDLPMNFVRTSPSAAVLLHQSMKEMMESRVRLIQKKEEYYETERTEQQPDSIAAQELVVIFSNS